MQLADLVETSQAVSATRARREKIARLADCLARVPPGEAEIAVAFLCGEPLQGRLGVGWATLRDAAAGPAEAPALSLADVDRALTRLGALRGRGSAAARGRALRELLAACTAPEADFLRRLLLGELRQGALEGIVVEAAARAAGVGAAELRRAAMLSGRLPQVAAAALVHGAAGLGAFRIELFRPVQPMLAQTAGDLDASLARLERAALEWKLDGARVQVHRLGDEVRVWSRRGNEVTARVPELVEAVGALPVESAVLDGEAIALRDDGTPHPFQVTMRRFGRRLGVEAARRELPLRVFLFDCLHLDGEDCIDLPAAERWALLDARVPEALRVPRARVESADAAHAFLDAALARGHEGVMVKALDATYEAGRRGAGWLKVKPAHGFDLVVLAAEWGSGRRRGWLSNLHLGARDPATGGFVMLGKTFKGLTDETLAWQTERLGALAVARDGPVVHVRPELVVEIACDGVQASPHYPAGLALRFARVVRYRPDKRADQADTVDAVRALLPAAE
ncbi:MAG: ATP-dependent DNA ligase [Myxococcota bacterium]|nr:ATP-dependent DNA ligase [Myxococcota bacterium]